MCTGFLLCALQTAEYIEWWFPRCCFGAGTFFLGHCGPDTCQGSHASKVDFEQDKIFTVVTVSIVSLVRKL